jgi:ABC-type transport system involved in multi-copper enzyme maturation permease subunit
MTQTLAIFRDAYRELNSKKMFWITLVISSFVVLVFAAFGINEKGVTFLNLQMNTSPFDSNMIPRKKFYLFAFANIGVPVWLTWAASILALISTASIFPDFLASGSIELTLSKPISRLRLFLTKYVAGLLFVGLQVLAFSLASFLVIGIRGGTRDSWEPSILLAIPVVLVFFSYLFCICVLLGLLTRSTVASLLLTLLAWLGLWGVNSADGLLLVQRETVAVNADRASRRLDRQEQAARARLAELREQGQPIPGEGGTPLPQGASDQLEAVNQSLAKARLDSKEASDSARRWARYSGMVTLVKTILPKTADTIGLLDRSLLSAEDKKLFGGPRRDVNDDSLARFGNNDPEVVRRLEHAVRDRPVWWIVGTSLGFEALILGIGALVFCRRDF